MWVVAKPAQGRPRRFGSAVGCADCPVVLATLAWRITRYALARCARTDAPSMLLKRAARAATRPAVRGASDAQETASAQALKAKWGSMRLQRLQREAARAIRDVMRIKSEIIAERFSPETLESVTNLNFPMEAEPI